MRSVWRIPQTTPCDSGGTKDLRSLDNKSLSNISTAMTSVVISPSLIEISYFFFVLINRCKGIYKTLFDICRDADIVIADANGAESFQDWFTLPQTWLLLGEYFMATNEPLLAKESYSLFENKLEQRREPHQCIEELMGIDACLQIASTHARFQNFSQSLKFAEYAFKLNHFHAETRKILSKSSEYYRESLDKENRVFLRVQELWRQRAWTSQLMGRMKAQALQGLEERYSEDPYNLTTRGLLAYYARGKYRAQFLFEVVCARRIQRAYRSRRFVLLWLKALTTMYRIDATAVVGKFRKTPYDCEVRRDLRRIERHRLCPQKHPIHQMLSVLDRQDRAVSMVRRVYRMHQLKRFIYTRMQVRRDATNRLENACALFIQCYFRCKLARIRMAEQRLYRLEVIKAAVILQRYVRWRNSSFQHAVTRTVRIRKEKKLIAQRTFIFKLKYVVRRYFERKRESKRLKVLEEEEQQRRGVIMEYREYLGVCSRRISRLLRRCEALKLAPLALRCHIYRGRHELSVGSKGLYAAEGGGAGGGGGGVFLISLPSGLTRRNNSDKNDNSGNRDSSNNTVNSNNNYNHDFDSTNQLPKIPHTGTPRLTPHAPETRETKTITPLFKTISGPNNPLFKAILVQKSVYCSSSFAAPDLMFLSSALTHPCCEIESLVFHDVPVLDLHGYEDILLPAIRACRSVREVKILKGHHSSSFLLNLLHIIQMENPRIISLFIEGIDRVIAKRISYELSLAAGRLLSDYFNYSLPGVRTVSLHGCYLQDSHLTLMCEGLQINTALRDLTLSRNLITDIGLISLFSSVSKNQKSSLRLLDLSCNFITGKVNVRNMFEAYRAPVSTKLQTEVPLLRSQLFIIFYFLCSVIFIAHTRQAVQLLYVLASVSTVRANYPPPP